MRIFKYTVGRESTILPAGSEILHIEAQHGNISIWAMVPEVKVPGHGPTIYCCGTGSICPLPKEYYRQTIQLHDGQYVFHIFVEPEKTVPSP